MKRLVYNPKVYIFIKDQKGNIHDVSRYVTSGRVTRKIDQVSDAEFTLRNTHMLFTVHEDDDGNIVYPLFSPMDPVTIFLRRVRQRPVRVFTGFLDKTPYLQLFPGPATYTASCTLKRLQHKYFDPALPYTQSFFKYYGWIPSGDGVWTSATGMANPDANRIGANAKEILHIGDSLGNGSIRPLRQELRGVTIQDDSTDGRTTTQAVDILESRVQRGSMPPAIIMNIGTNDSDAATFRAQVRRAINLVGNNRHIIWPNIARPNRTGWATAAELNEILAEESQIHRNLTVIDWNSAVTNGKVQVSDGIHTNPAGYSYRAAAIADAVNDGGGNSSKATRVVNGRRVSDRQEIDGSLSQLLMATMTYIGQWDENDVYIEQLPNDLFERVRDLAQEFNDDAQEAREEFLRFIKGIVGTSTYGSATGDTSTTDAATGEVKGAENIVPTMKSIAEKYSVPPELLITTSLIETELGQNMHREGAPYWGWFQIDINGSRYSPPETKEHLLDLGIASTYFAKAAAHEAKNNPSLRNDPLQWAMITQGVNGQNNQRYPQIWDAQWSKAKGLLEKYGESPTGPQGLPGGPARTKKAQRRDGRQDKNSNSNETKLYSPIKGASDQGWPGSGGSYGASRGYGAHAGVDMPSSLGEPWYAILDGVVDSVNQNWANGQPAVVVRSTQKVDGYPDPLFLGYGSFQSVNVKSGDRVIGGKTVLGAGGQHGSGPHLHFFLADKTGATNGTMDPTKFLKAAVNGEQPTGGPGGDPVSGGGGTTSGATEGMSVAAGAFFASLNLPSAYDAIEAALLGGQKSLMNDKPLLPFIQQLTQASLRHFQSLPDGRFYAFYPDYFGEMNQHPPYWEIEDIEILDGKVELSDDALVTHMYVVGDTAQPMTGNSPFPIRSLFSSGVVTIFNAFMSNSLLDRERARADNKREARKAEGTQPHKERPEGDIIAGMSITLDDNEVASFLERYGARPHIEDMPMIRNPYYEMFLAYQKFLLAWSRQFLTPFSFTFMPELYPGGKVGFPDHNLQMYIEEVTHTWDYESGFTTTAVLSAPSIYGAGRGRNKLPPNMVRALIEPSAPESVAVKREQDNKRKTNPKPSKDTPTTTTPNPLPPQPPIDWIDDRPPSDLNPYFPNSDFIEGGG